MNKFLQLARRGLDYGKSWLLPGSLGHTVRSVRKKKLTFLPTRKLNSLARLTLQVEREGIDGMLIEAGCALGGSAIVMAAAKAPTRPLGVYDVFEMIPPPTDEDDEDVHKRYEVIKSGKAKGLGGKAYYGYRDDLYEAVEHAFSDEGYPIHDHSVSLVKGLVQDTLNPTGPVAIAHIDVDWYEPVMTCLERIEPLLAPGGYLVLDDYLIWSGSRKATDAYFEDRRDGFSFDTSSGSLVIRKKR